MLAEELKLEAVLEKQEAAKKRKADAISKLTNKELFYQSEILKLEEQLEKFEAKQEANPSPNGNTFGQDMDEDIEFWKLMFTCPLLASTFVQSIAIVRNKD